MTRSKQNQWQLVGNQAHFIGEGLDLHVDVAQPHEGIELHRQGDLQPQIFFKTTQVAPIANEKLDPYARGADLIVAYPCSEKRWIGGELSWRVRTHLDRGQWGAVAESGATNQDSDSDSSPSFFVSVELVYSIQTLLLDSRPHPRLESRLYGESIRIFQADPENGLQPHEPGNPAAAWLVRNQDQSMLLTVMPSDALSLNLQSTKSNRDGLTQYVFEWDLASDFLEKGVIRRLRAFVVIGQNEVPLIQAANDFFVSEIPLTA